VPEHPVYRAEEAVELKYAPILEQVEYGCRTSVIYAPPQQSARDLKSLSCYWELAAGRDRQVPNEIRGRMQAALSVGTNVLTYATGREPKFKDPQRISVEKEKTKVRDERGTLYVAKVQHPGGCNAAPGALLNLLRAAEEDLELRVGIQARLLPLTDESIFRHHMLFMHGRHKFQFTEEERKQLALFLQRGGLLFADSICSNAEFAEAFRSEIRKVMAEIDKDIPLSPLERIPLDHPLLSKEYGGYDIRQVARRDPGMRVRRQRLQARERQVEPDLEGIKVGDRYGVIFSPYDISCALEQKVALECEGYVRKDAARIGLNVLLYSLHR